VQYSGPGQSPAVDFLLNQRCTATSAPTQDIACNTLTYVSARKGLPTLFGSKSDAMCRRDGRFSEGCQALNFTPSDRDPLDFIERDFITGAIVEFGGARAFMRRHRLRVFERNVGWGPGKRHRRFSPLSAGVSRVSPEMGSSRPDRQCNLWRGACYSRYAEWAATSYPTRISGFGAWRDQPDPLTLMSSPSEARSSASGSTSMSFA
jgi:hypothetical protein